MDQLFLRASEKKQFSALKPDLREGWTVVDETYRFTDSSALRTVRFQMLRLKDPVLSNVQKRFMGAKNGQEFEAALQTLNFSSVGNHEFTKLLFALGPDAMDVMLAGVLEGASSEADIELAAALSGIRHLMLESLIEVDF